MPSLSRPCFMDAAEVPSSFLQKSNLGLEMLASGSSNPVRICWIASAQELAEGRRLLTVSWQVRPALISMLVDPTGERKNTEHSSEKDPNHWDTHLTLIGIQT